MNKTLMCCLHMGLCMGVTYKHGIPWHLWLKLYLCVMYFVYMNIFVYIFMSVFVFTYVWMYRSNYALVCWRTSPMRPPLQHITRAVPISSFASLKAWSPRAAPSTPAFSPWLCRQTARVPLSAALVPGFVWSPRGLAIHAGRVSGPSYVGLPLEHWVIYAALQGLLAHVAVVNFFFSVT